MSMGNEKMQVTTAGTVPSNAPGTLKTSGAEPGPSMPAIVQTGAWPESSVASTVMVTGTVCPLGGKTADGEAVTLLMTGGVESFASCGVRRKTAGWPLNLPSPAMTPFSLIAFAIPSTQPGASVRVFRSNAPSASRCANACVVTPSASVYQPALTPAAIDSMLLIGELKLSRSTT